MTTRAHCAQRFDLSSSGIRSCRDAARQECDGNNGHPLECMLMSAYLTLEATRPALPRHTHAHSILVPRRRGSA
jgi:hypothetical protein